LEVPIVGKKYTWYKSNGPTKSKLERVLVFDEWFQKWSMCKKYVHPRKVSNHCAIVVKSFIKDWGLRPFRTIYAWHMESGFKDMLKDK